MSEALNIVKASFGGLREVATAPLWQWDYGQILRITGLDLPQAFEVHFSNSRKSGETITQIGTDSQVVIPDMYLTSGADIYCFIFLHDGLTDGETEYVIKIPVRERPEPSDIEPTPEQQDVITEAIAALNAAVAQCDAQVEHYPTVIDGYWYVWDEAQQTFVTTGVPATGNGIADARLNNDYTLTLIFTDGSSFTTPISIRGATGATPSISATAKTLSEGSSATVSVTGTAENPVIKFGIPKGDTGYPTDAQVQSAVDEWYEEHPEGIVPDGSLTEAKFTSATWNKVKNDYVTPQMYGALADGSTDDTAAIQAAFDSGYDVFFPHGVYMTSGVTISETIHVKFDNATLKANTTYQAYVLNVTAKVYFAGYLKVNGDTKAYCGVVFANAGASHIEMIDVEYCLSWGVDIVSGGHMVFDHIYTAYCGNSIPATVSYVSSNVLNIDTSLTSHQKEILSADKYYSHIYVQDDTGYNDDTSDNRPGPMIYAATGYDKESGQIATTSSVKSNYTSKSCYILCGGGIHVNINIFTQIDFNVIDTRLGPTGIRFDSTYGHHIQNMYSQSDRIGVMFTSYNLGTMIGSITVEESKSGYNIWSAHYNYSVILARSTGHDENFRSSNIATAPHKSSPLYNPVHLKTLIRRTIPFYYYMGETLVLTEQSPDNIFFQSSRSGLTINLRDTFQSTKSYNPWGVKTLYFMPNTVQSSDITLTLANSLINNGYTIHGGQNGAITFPRPSLWFKVEIYLTYATKEFTLSVTPIEKFEPST